jgi:hyperosmotically inducible periplasmic protein
VYGGVQIGGGGVGKLLALTEEEDIMKSKISAARLLMGSLVVMGTALTSVASHADAEHSRPATFVKDSVITTKIKAKLAAEHLASATQLSVDTDNNGVVWISGVAASQAEADKAVSIARTTEGVSAVKSEITIKPK